MKDENKRFWGLLNFALGIVVIIQSTIIQYTTNTNSSIVIGLGVFGTVALLHGCYILSRDKEVN